MQKQNHVVSVKGIRPNAMRHVARGMTHGPRDLIADTDTTHDPIRTQTALPTTTPNDDTTHVRSIRSCRGGLQTVLPGDSVCRRPGYYLPLRSIIHSFQLRAYEQGTRARLSQAEDDLRALRRERDDALRDLNASREQTQVWVAEVDKWKSEVRGLASLYTLHRLCLHSSQANSALVVVKYSFAELDRRSI